METQNQLENQSQKIVINYFSQGLEAAFKRLEKEAPRMLEMSEKELINNVRPDDVLYRLRTSFWTELFRCENTGKKMMDLNIYSGVCSKYLYYAKLKSNKTMAWFMCLPTNVEIAMKDSLSRGVENLLEVMTMDIKDDDGKIDVKRASLFIKTFAFVHEMVHGKAVQRIEQKTIAKIENTHVTLDHHDRLQELEAKYGTEARGLSEGHGTSGAGFEDSSQASDGAAEKEAPALRGEGDASPSVRLEDVPVGQEVLRVEE